MIVSQFEHSIIKEPSLAGAGVGSVAGSACGSGAGLASLSFAIDSGAGGVSLAAGSAAEVASSTGAG